MSSERPRRAFLRSVAAGSVVAVAGCGGDQDDDEPNEDATVVETTDGIPNLFGGTTTESAERPPPTTERSPATTERPPETTDEPTTTDQPPETRTEPLEILHSWSAGDGHEALSALIQGFREAHPEIDFAVDPVADGAVANLPRRIQQRLNGANPPSTWQAWPGGNLQKYSGTLGDIGQTVWHEEMRAAYPDGARAQATLDGVYVAVPVDVHRTNNLFYNKHVLEEAGVDPSTLSSPSALLDACETVASNTDAVPFAHAGKVWTTAQLWGSVLLAEVGVDGYQSVVQGNGSVSQVESTLETIRSLGQYYPSDTSSISWLEANHRLIDGEAAFIHQGDWAAGAYEGASEFAYGTDWDRQPFPGTDGQYLMVMDAFLYPADNPSPEATATFLRYCGSAAGQKRFNPPKGSVPPRTDVDPSALDAFQRDQYRQYRRANARMPSIVHGLATSSSVRRDVTAAFGGFVGDTGTEETAREIVDAFE